MSSIGQDNCRLIAGNKIAYKLIKKGADLAQNVKEANNGNLFHKIIASGKDELVREAMVQAKS